ncbi:unnamed protein product [Rotaria sordida]|uniref:Uncharacterized protein n=1 Tax=Rotaria sordida TaxID=392033 RepID=A0A818SBT6_9BILA|nr:unnamed protein product [Rotaria sordida]
MELNNNDEIEICEVSDAEATTTQIVEEHLIRSIRDFIPPSSTLTKPIAAELSLVYHSVRQNISCGKTKARELSVNVLEVVEQPLESAENITNTIHDILKKHNLDIQKLTSVGTNNANTNYG